MTDTPQQPKTFESQLPDPFAFLADTFSPGVAAAIRDVAREEALVVFATNRESLNALSERVQALAKNAGPTPDVKAVAKAVLSATEAHNATGAQGSPTPESVAAEAEAIKALKVRLDNFEKDHEDDLVDLDEHLTKAFNDVDGKLAGLRAQVEGSDAALRQAGTLSSPSLLKVGGVTFAVALAFGIVLALVFYGAIDWWVPVVAALVTSAFVVTCSGILDGPHYKAVRRARRARAQAQHDERARQDAKEAANDQGLKVVSGNTNAR